MRWTFLQPVFQRRLGRGLVATGVVLVLWLAVSLAIASRLTGRRHPLVAEPVPKVAWAQFEPIRLATRDGERIGGWYAEGRDTAPSVLLLHGNGGNRKNCLAMAEVYAAEGCAVLLISLRAHGDSTGTFNDIGYSARHDVAEAVAFLERRRPSRPVLIHGTSMGAAAAVFAAHELQSRVAGYLLECPYRDLKTAVWNRVENALPPILDWAAYRGLLIVSPLVVPELEEISPLSAIASVPDDVPVMILCGGADRRARLVESRALFERVRSHGTLVVFDEADHMRLSQTDPERYRQQLLRFLESIRRQKPSRVSPATGAFHQSVGNG